MIENMITSFFHCRKCIEEKPKGTSPRDFSRLEVGYTTGSTIQVWCMRHDINVGVIGTNDAPPIEVCESCEHDKGVGH